MQRSQCFKAQLILSWCHDHCMTRSGGAVLLWEGLGEHKRANHTADAKNMLWRSADALVGGGGGGQGPVLVRVSSCVKRATFGMFLTFCHYCHFTWEAGQRRERALTADWPQMLFIWLISLQTTIPSLNCGGAYRGRRWEGASTGEMSHQGSQRGVKLRLTSAGSVAPLCPLCAPGKMI